MIGTTTETMNGTEYLTVRRVCAMFPGRNGRGHVQPSTVTRWILAGVPARGNAPQTRIHLAATRVGGRWLITRAALAAFTDALTAEPEYPDAVPIRAPSAERRSREIAAARDALARRLARKPR